MHVPRGPHRVRLSYHIVVVKEIKMTDQEMHSVFESMDEIADAAHEDNLGCADRVSVNCRSAGISISRASRE